MTKKTDAQAHKNPGRAILKMTVLLLGLLVIAGVLAGLVDDSLIDQLKFNLSLGALIGLVVVINIISLICFIGLYAAYQWIRCDLKAPRSEDLERSDQKDQG